MSSLKEVKGSYFPFFFILLINSFMIYLFYGESAESFSELVMVFIFVNGFIFFLSKDMFHDFNIYEDRIVVKNLVNPYFSKSYFFTELERINFNGGGLSGLFVELVDLKGKQFKYTCNHISIEKIRKMVSEINELLTEHRCAEK